MAVLTSKIQVESDTFRENRASMLDCVARLRSYEQRTRDASNRRLATFRARGQLSPQERLDGLLDPGMPFLQLHSMANFRVEEADESLSVPGASVIVGIGFVGGVRCMIWVDDSGIAAGAATESTLAVSTSLLKLCFRQKLPLVHLVESAGANLLKYKVELWSNFGGVFRDLARLSAAGLPTMVVLHGGSTAGGAYMPGMSDYVIGVKENGMAALGGAALVKAATGEDADERQLGGSEMHASVSGVVEYLVEDDVHGLLKAREVMDRLDWNRRMVAPARRDYEQPRYPAEELAGAIPTDPKIPYDFREVLARVVDGSSVEEFKPRYGISTVCGHTSITGIACGFIGNNGPIDPSGATKAAQFIQLCDQADVPIIFFNNTTGYMVGTEYEQAGMIKHGSKMIQAVANARVPKLSLYIGASYGAGNYGMCGWSYEPDFLFAWPNARTGVMAGQSAATTMTEVAKVGAARKGKEIPAAVLEEQAATIRQHFDNQEDAFYTSGRVLDHGIIDPRDTRKVLAFCLETVLESRQRELQPNSFGVARM